MRYEKHTVVAGNWVKGNEVVSGSRCKLVSETKAVKSQFKDEKTGADKFQDVAKIQFEGKDPMNISLNRTTINALIDAFGEESANWQGHHLTAQVEKTVVGGRRVNVVYLVPQGYVMGEDENGYVVIAKEDEEPSSSAYPVSLEDGVEDIKPSDIPF